VGDNPFADEEKLKNRQMYCFYPHQEKSELLRKKGTSPYLFFVIA
jgi:hypothetical protein